MSLIDQKIKINRPFIFEFHYFYSPNQIVLNPAFFSLGGVEGKTNKRSKKQNQVNQTKRNNEEQNSAKK